MKKNNTLAEMIMLSNTSHNLRLLDYVTRLVSKYYNISLEEIISKTRKREICFPRQVAMHLLKKHTNLSLSAIGAYFNGKDHATVLHAYRTVINLMDSDKTIKDDVFKLNKTIKSKATAIKKQTESNNDFYYIDFNNYFSVKVKDYKGLMLSGFNDEEIKKIMSVVDDIVETRLHENTGFYILEQKTIE
jgi:hypothetical protein